MTMADNDASRLTDAEVFKLTKELRAKYRPWDPVNAPPPVPADPDDMTELDKAVGRTGSITHTVLEAADGAALVAGVREAGG